MHTLQKSVSGPSLFTAKLLSMTDPRSNRQDQDQSAHETKILVLTPMLNLDNTSPGPRVYHDLDFRSYHQGQGHIAHITCFWAITFHR